MRVPAGDDRVGAGVTLLPRLGDTLPDDGRSRNSKGSRSELCGDDRSDLRVVVLRATWPARLVFVNDVDLVLPSEPLFG